MSSTTNDSNYSVMPTCDNREDDPDELVFSLKQGICLKDVQKKGTVFDLDMDRDLADLSYPSKEEYFDKECLFEELTYPDDTDSDTGDDQDNREPFEKIRAKMTPITADNGVMKRIRKPGFGGLPPEKSQVTIHYNGYLEFLDEPFDSTRLRNRPMRFILSEGEVLIGLNIAVASMRQNELAEFLIGPMYGLGEMGCPPRIPPNATILYVVELLNIVDCGAAIEFDKMNPDERKVAPFAKVMEVCKADNRKARELFKNKQYHRCIKLYNKAIRVLSEVTMADEKEERQQQSLLTKLYSNLSACFLNMNAPDRAIPCALNALKIDPNNNKALFRCGKASRLNGDFRTAKRYLREVGRKEPNNMEVREEMEKLDADIEKYQKLEKEFCSKIFKSDSKPVAPKTLTTNLIVSEDFKTSIEKNLAKLKEGELDSMPFTFGFSDLEIRTVQEIATKMGLPWEVPEHGDAKLRVYNTKSKP